MGIIESDRAEISRLKVTVQELRDEISRLKGEQGKPNIRGKKGANDISSEKERKTEPPKPRKKRVRKKDKITITRTVTCEYPKDDLPDDVIFKGYDSVIVQNFKIVPDNVEFKIEIYYSPSTGKTYRAKRPAEYKGQFGTDIRSFILIMKHLAKVSESSIHSLLTTYGCHISKSSISRLSRKDAGLFHEEKEKIFRAGLLSSNYQHIDDTGARVNGSQWYTHILCSPYYTAYFTRPHKDRLTILKILSLDSDLQFEFNETALKLLKTFKMTDQIFTHIKESFDKRPMNEEMLDSLLQHLPTKIKNPTQLHRRIKEAGAIGWYQTQKELPVIEFLMSDDAPQFRHIALEHALCWVHAGRHLKRLNPLTPLYQQEVDCKLQEFWNLFRDLNEYRENQSSNNLVVLEERFDKLVSGETEFLALNKVMKNLRENKEKLLQVLKNPELPLHNNPAELGARAKVRNRDVSLHTLTKDGTEAVDTFLTLVQTAKKLGVNISKYINAVLSDRDVEPISITLMKKAKSMMTG